MIPADEVERVCTDLDSAIDELRAEGMRLDMIYPADEPHTALLSGGGRRVRATTRPDAEKPSGELPPFTPGFRFTRAADEGGQGRAGMLYRDLIPGRLGGRYIASHIRILEGGPVADWVHFHRIALQLIYVRSGWVRVVYEDQGEPFFMQAGDLVLQPPGIRHRVLESSPGLEVVEITCPALHETFADHELELPNGSNLDRIFGAQSFVRHIAERSPWKAFGGGEAQETAISSATSGMAEVQTVRSHAGQPIVFPPHDGELVFGFVLGGSARLDFRDGFPIGAADCFVIPSGERWRITEPSEDFRLLHVTTAQLG